MSKVSKIILLVVAALVLVCVAIGVYIISSMRAGTVDIVKKPEDLEAVETISIEGVDPTEEPVSVSTPEPMPIYQEASIDDSVVNIMLVGTDSRNSGDAVGGRSDSMMLASLNKSTGKLTLISFMRDARVWRVGTKGRFSFQNRLNGAFSGGYGGGGPGELINTINYNFGLDVQEYICIGFNGFAALIDQIGGLDVPLNQAEINFINDRITGHHYLEPDIVKEAERVKAEPGIVHLNGAQALVYARDRHTAFGDGDNGNDYDRVGRQQYVIQLVYEKVTAKMNEQSVIALLTFATNHVTTNMSLDTMISLAKTLLTADVSFNTKSIPGEGDYQYFVDETGSKTDQLSFDIKETAAAINELLYGPAPSTPAQGN